MKGYHEILDVATHRYVLARYIGVDAMCCSICVILGWKSRALLQPVWKMVSERKLPPASRRKERVESYIPVAFRNGLFFFAYQIKDLLDTIIWGGNIEFLIHHCFSILTAWGIMYPGKFE